VQQVKEAENILLVKAAKVKFPETNLSVITSDGNLYSFSVKYDSLACLLVYRLSKQSSNSISGVLFKERVMNNAEIETYAKSVFNKTKTISGIRYKKWQMLGRVNGIYIKDDVMFFRLLLENRSSIDYDIDFIRFYLHDDKISKRTATQEQELKPLRIIGNTPKVKADNKRVSVFAFEKFTIPDAKSFLIEVAEKNGGRHLLLKVTNEKLIKAKAIPDLAVNN
jgi:conjugative transposon TraN protein